MNSTHTIARAALRNARPARTPSLQCRNASLSTRLTTPTTTLQPRPTSSAHQFQPSRTFTTTAPLHKKGAKQAREEKRASQPSSGPASEDPSDFSTLEAEISSAIEKLKDDLSKLRAGGRFNPEVLEGLKVQVEKGSAKKVKLSDVAQVVPKGRVVQVIVGEREHVKPVSTAIQSSTLSLNPQPDPTGTNPLLLLINIPPPTADSRKAVVAEAAKAGDKASTAIKDARGKQQKKLRAMQLSKTALPDELKKAGTLMEKVAEKGGAEVKKVVEGARKVLESG